MIENVLYVVTPEVPMSEESKKIWDDIAEKNTASLTELMAMTPEERASLNVK